MEKPHSPGPPPSQQPSNGLETHEKQLETNNGYRSVKLRKERKQGIARKRQAMLSSDMQEIASQARTTTDASGVGFSNRSLRIQQLT